MATESTPYSNTFTVWGEADKKALSTSGKAHYGDLVYVISTYRLYAIADETKLDSDDGYTLLKSYVPGLDLCEDVTEDSINLANVDLPDDEEYDEGNPILNEFLSTFKINKG